MGPRSCGPTWTRLCMTVASAKRMDHPRWSQVPRRVRERRSISSSLPSSRTGSEERRVRQMTSARRHFKASLSGVPLCWPAAPRRRVPLGGDRLSSPPTSSQFSSPPSLVLILVPSAPNVKQGCARCILLFRAASTVQGQLAIGDMHVTMCCGVATCCHRLSHTRFPSLVLQASFRRRRLPTSGSEATNIMPCGFLPSRLFAILRTLCFTFPPSYEGSRHLVSRGTRRAWNARASMLVALIPRCEQSVGFSAVIDLLRALSSAVAVIGTGCRTFPDGACVDDIAASQK